MAIGKTSSTRMQSNTSDEFSFWLATNARVNPTDIVVTQNPDGSHTYGLVTRIENISDSESHLDNFVSHDFGSTTATPHTQRLSTNVARCVVLKNTQNIYMPVVGGQNVEFANADGILTALGIGEVQQANPNFRSLPAGIIELSNGERAPATIDARYLLGPEGAHFNITGISGLAAKTSYAMFLLNVLLQRYSNEVAAIIFNVKQDDLLYINQPSVNPLDERQQELWRVLEVSPQPFQNVTYFIPRGEIGRRDARQVVSNSYAQTPPQGHLRYSYALKDMSDKLSYLFTHVEDPRETLRALLEDIEEDLQAGSIRTSTFTQLIEHFQQILRPPQAEGQQRRQQRRTYHEHRHSTIGKFVRLFRYFVQTGTSGLFVDNKADNEVTLAHYIWAIRPGQVYVIDIARLHDFERGFVVGDVVNEVYRLFARDITYGQVPQEIRQRVWQGQEIDPESPIEPPSKLVFFVDELNKYAPAGKEISPILHNLLEITERGRSLGVILLGAEQFASDVHPRIIGNCSNKIYGRSDSTELGDQAYRHIPQDLKALITRLDQGTLLLQHPLYRQPVKIRFPRPVYREPHS
ncbi:MAG: ATP-binding protein [Thermoproteota archaeon]